MQYNNYLGIDVSKKTLDYALLPQDKKVFNYRTTNDAQGLKELHKKVKGHGVSFDKILVCAEKTGIYSDKFSMWMQKKDITSG